jgi:hypothetical protein
MKWMFSSILILVSFAVQAADGVPRDLQVIFLGDTRHGDVLEQQRLASAVSAVTEARTDIDCLFVEFPAAAQPELDAYMAGATKYKDSILKYIAYQEEKTQTFGNVNLAPQIFLDTARKAGLRVRGMDMDFTLPDGLKLIDNIYRYYNTGLAADAKIYIQTYVDDRNRIMAENIAKDFQSGVCKGGVAIVGVDHLLPQSDGFDVTPMQSTSALSSLKTGRFLAN